MTQRDRVLRALRQAGRDGITQVDFLGPVTPDSGPPITRLASRIYELRQEGYPIENAGRRDKCDVYVLPAAKHPVVATPAPPTPPAAPERAHSPAGATGDDSGPVVIPGQLSFLEAA